MDLVIEFLFSKIHGFRRHSNCRCGTRVPHGHPVTRDSGADNDALRITSAIPAANHQSPWTAANAVTHAGNSNLNMKIAPRAAKAAANMMARYPKILGRIGDLTRIIPRGKNTVGAATMK